MKTFRNHTAYVFVLAALVGVYAAPANAGGGRSGAQASSGEAHKASERLSHAPCDAQMQIDALRKEMTELKARLDAEKNVVVSK